MKQYIHHDPRTGAMSLVANAEDSTGFVIGCDFAKTPDLTARSTYCLMCKNTGDVYDQSGSWRGRCTCPAGRALKPWTPTDVRKNEPPCDHSERIDVKFRDGHIVRDCLPNTWAWGEAGNATITYWRKSK